MQTSEHVEMQSGKLAFPKSMKVAFAEAIVLAFLGVNWFAIECTGQRPNAARINVCLLGGRH